MSSSLWMFASLFGHFELTVHVAFDFKYVDQFFKMNIQFLDNENYRNTTFTLDIGSYYYSPR